MRTVLTTLAATIAALTFVFAAPRSARVAQVPAPAVLEVSSVTPKTTVKQPDGQTLRVDGRGFVSGLAVTLVDPTGAVTKISGTDIRQVTPASFQVWAVLPIEGGYTLAVINPDRAVSNAVSLTVTAKVAPPR